MKLNANRLDWVDTAKGLSIILVVMMHSAYGVGDDMNNIGVLHYTIGWATPFRMPEFFMISGLFLSQVIARPWSLYGDRRILHYLYFYFLWAFLQIAFKVGLGTGDLHQAVSDLLSTATMPYGVLWFIYMLAVYSLATKLLYTLKVPHWLALAAAVGLQLWETWPPYEHVGNATGIYTFDHFALYYVFFYAGYVFAPRFFQLVAWAQAHVAQTIGILVAYGLVEWFMVFNGGVHMMPRGIEMGYASIPGIWLALAFAGSLALCLTASLLVLIPWMRWLRWLGEHSIVIYLSFSIPMSALRTVILKFHLLSDTSTVSVIVWLFSLASPVILYLIIQATGWGKFLFERPAWAHIPGTPGSRGYVARPKIQPAE